MTVTTDRSPLTGTWNLDPAHTRIGFSARHAMVTTVRGSFTDVSGVLNLDGEDPSTSTANVVVQTASIETGQPDRDAHLRSADFLDAEKWPTITFASTGARSKGEDGFVLTGDLTVREVTRPVEFAITFLGSSADPFGNSRTGFEGTAEISRKDFGLTWNVALETGGFLVSDKVKITLDVSAIKQVAAAVS
ncbi:MAG: YceI family protein [Actinomycetota bacterium]